MLFRSVLGEHHDCEVLRAAIRHGDFILDAGERAQLEALIGDRMGELERQAFDLGRQVYAERPAALARRMARYWTTA